MLTRFGYELCDVVVLSFIVLSSVFHRVIRPEGRTGQEIGAAGVSCVYSRACDFDEGEKDKKMVARITNRGRCVLTF